MIPNQIALCTYQKKNFYLNGFVAMGMLIWTPDAYEEQTVEVKAEHEATA